MHYTHELLVCWPCYHLFALLSASGPNSFPVLMNVFSRACGALVLPHCSAFRHARCALGTVFCARRLMHCARWIERQVAHAQLVDEALPLFWPSPCQSCSCQGARFPKTIQTILWKIFAKKVLVETLAVLQSACRVLIAGVPSGLSGSQARPIPTLRISRPGSRDADVLGEFVLSLGDLTGNR